MKKRIDINWKTATLAEPFIVMADIEVHTFNEAPSKHMSMTVSKHSIHLFVKDNLPMPELTEEEHSLLKEVARAYYNGSYKISCTDVIWTLK